MKNLFIFITFIIILFFAFLDAKNLYAELNSVATSRTPSQIEIRPIINRQRGESDNVQFDKDKNYQHEKMRNDVNHNIQDNINKMNERQNQRDIKKP